MKKKRWIYALAVAGGLLLNQPSLMASGAAQSA